MSLPAKAAATERHRTPAELEAYGIVVSQMPVYEWNGYRYTNASDAIAAAKRGARP